MKITLCGSTKFMEAFTDWNIILTKAGFLVYSVCTSLKNNGEQNLNDGDTIKRRLDLVHLGKILESDAIVVLNKDKYIGDSTKREIEWATMNDKPVYWLELPIPGSAYPGMSVWHLHSKFTGLPIAQIVGTEKYTQV